MLKVFISCRVLKYMHNSLNQHAHSNFFCNLNNQRLLIYTALHYTDVIPFTVFSPSRNRSNIYFTIISFYQFQVKLFCSLYGRYLLRMYYYKNCLWLISLGKNVIFRLLCCSFLLKRKKNVQVVVYSKL